MTVVISRCGSGENNCWKRFVTHVEKRPDLLEQDVQDWESSRVFAKIMVFSEQK